MVRSLVVRPTEHRFETAPRPPRVCCPSLVFGHLGRHSYYVNIKFRLDGRPVCENQGSEMANNSGLSKRAALRQQQEMEERQAKNRKFIMGGAAALAVVVLVVIGIVISQSVGGSDNGETAAEQLRPPHATSGEGIEIPPTDEVTAEDVPHLIIWQDYQCPACGYYESQYGPAVNELVDSGQITAENRSAYFLDQGRGDASKRAAMAAAAADEVGFYREYHHQLFANQQGGYTNEALREVIPQQIGLEGEELTRFQELYDTRAYNDFADAAHEAFNESPWTGTPTYEVNGERLIMIDPDTQEVYVQPTAEDMLRAITELDGN